VAMSGCSASAPYSNISRSEDVMIDVSEVMEYLKSLILLYVEDEEDIRDQFGQLPLK
jgi:hypothetical protein